MPPEEETDTSRRHWSCHKFHEGRKTPQSERKRHKLMCHPKEGIIRQERFANEDTMTEEQECMQDEDVARANN